jgi:hypothetical protein
MVVQDIAKFKLYKTGVIGWTLAIKLFHGEVFRVKKESGYYLKIADKQFEKLERMKLNIHFTVIDKIPEA